MLTLALKVPEEMRVVILQQTDVEDVNTGAGLGQTTMHLPAGNNRNVLEDVIERATAKHEAQGELEGKAGAS